MIKGKIMPQIFRSKKNLYRERGKKSPCKAPPCLDRFLCLKAAVLRLTALTCSTHGTSVARTRSHAPAKWAGTQCTGYCRTSRYLNAAEWIWTGSEPLWPREVGSMDGTRKLDLPYCWITASAGCDTLLTSRRDNPSQQLPVLLRYRSAQASSLFRSHSTRKHNHNTSCGARCAPSLTSFSSCETELRRSFSDWVLARTFLSCFSSVCNSITFFM